MHGQHQSGVQPTHQLRRRSGIDGIGAAHRQHQRIAARNFLLLRRCQDAAQVPQMHHGHALRPEDMNGVIAPEGALTVVVEGGEHLHLKGIFPAGQQCHRLQTIVVKVVVTDIDGVGLHPQRRIARHIPIGIDDQPVARRLQPKAAVAQPCDIHKRLLSRIF